MGKIKYVCLSDMHLGEEDGLLTNLQTASNEPDPSNPSPVLEKLVKCLETFKFHQQNPKPTLILNGDIPELALTTSNVAAMVFEQFVKLILPRGKEMFEKIIYIPGNHDHHLWEVARESQWLGYVTRNIPPGGIMPIPYHSTNIFVEEEQYPVAAPFLSGFIQRFDHLKEFPVHVAYPNFGIHSSDWKKVVLFHHGHFIEPIYQLMSTLKTMLFKEYGKPQTVNQIEAENFAWIDFFWSTMGRSGEAGKAIETVYERLREPEEMKKLLSNFVDGINEKYDLPGWDRLTSKIAKSILNAAVDRISKKERKQTEKPLSKEAEKGLWEYVTIPLKTQLQDEYDYFKKQFPTDATLVLGHTHKPFEQDMNFDGYENWVHVYNTGGWVVDTVEPASMHGGSIVFVDDEFNVASIRMYNEGHKFEDYEVRVKEATGGIDISNPLYNELKDTVEQTPKPFHDFSTVAYLTVIKREQNLRARLARK